MKTFILVILSSFFAFGQPDHFGELIIRLVNRPSSYNITIKLTAVSVRWDADNLLTEGYELVTNSASNDVEYIYFDHIKDILAGNYPIFAVGLYKVSAYEDNNERAYFFMDWRTSAEDWTSPDVYFDYDINNRQFKAYTTADVINYSYQTLWDLKDVSHVTSGLENFWSNALAVTNDQDRHPRLVWGPHPDGQSSHYRIYRKFNSGAWSQYASVGGSQYTYIDQNVTISTLNTTDYYNYYVKGAYIEIPPDTTLTSATNTVNAFVSGHGNDKKNVLLPQTLGDYSLAQNYPNPFNPTTLISWEMPSDHFVTLRVYNLLGCKIATLVNELRKAGSQSVQFDASNLPSGIYFYQIQMGEFMAIRKAIFQK